MQPSDADYADGNGWSSPSSPPSFIKDLPEIVKLMLASLLVAVIVHAFFASRRNAKIEAERGPSVHGRVGAVGSSTSVGGDKCADNDIGNESTNEGSDDNGGRILGNALTATSTTAPEPGDEKPPAATKSSAKARTKSSAKKFAQNAVAERNYDALICKVTTDEDDSDEGKIKPSAGQNNNQKLSSSIPKQNNKETTNSKDAEDDEVVADTTPHNDELTQPLPLPPPPIELKSQAKHPGLQGYYNWHATITSLYRIYAIPSYEDASNNGSDIPTNRKYHQAILPMHPASERGQVPVYIEVTNRTSHSKIDVYWIDYKGNEVRKGSIPNRGGVWSQTTFIGHPWTFRVGEGEENVLVKYAPFRVLPSIAGVETSRESNGTVEGMQKFDIRDVPDGHVARLDNGLVPVCWVDDTILPEPTMIPRERSSSTAFAALEMRNAIQWSCHQIRREDAIYHGNGIQSTKRLLQYLKNICLHPDDPKYRRLRLCNRIFQDTIYNTGARGVLLALGFEELYGYMECGPGGGKMLPHERIQQISDAMVVVNQTLKVMEDSDGGGGTGVLVQPEGGDGFGRAGFGHAGGMNL